MHYFEYAIRELPRLSNIYARQFARFHAQMEIWRIEISSIWFTFSDI